MSKIKEVIADYKLLLENIPALVTLIFCIGTVAMNCSAAKIIFNAGNVAVTAGFLLSWLPFLCLDTVTRRFGARAAIMLNVLSAVCNAVFVIFMAITAAIPTKDDYTAYNSVYGAVWFIVLSSTLAFILSGVVNSLLNSALGKIMKSGDEAKPVEFYIRSFVSTFIGQVVDNFVFMWLLYSIFAPIFWGIAPMPILTCLGTGILGGLIELLCEVILSPCGYVMVKNWEKNNIGHEYIEAHKNDKL